jgi:hypothetical protein
VNQNERVPAWMTGPRIDLDDIERGLGSKYYYEIAKTHALIDIARSLRVIIEQNANAAE